MNLDDLKAYKLVKKENLSDIRSTGYLLRHIKTGARVMVIENDDENKVFNIAFSYSTKEQHRCRTHPGTQRALRIQRFSFKRSICRTGKRFFEYIFKCNDLSG